MLTSTDHAVQVFAAAIVTLTRLAIYPAASRWVASAFATLTLTCKTQRQSALSRRLTESGRLGKEASILLDFLDQF